MHQVSSSSLGTATLSRSRAYWIERVFGSELDGTRVDKRDLLRYALDEARVDPASAIMIGDRSHDVVGARTNGMTAIGVLYGYGSEAELRDAGAHHICAAHHELPDRCVA